MTPTRSIRSLALPLAVGLSVPMAVAVEGFGLLHAMIFYALALAFSLPGAGEQRRPELARARAR